MRKNNKGITLIALVVTIIVLLILAGVSIITLTGDSGIITRTGKAKKATEEAAIKENIRLAYSHAQIGKYAGKNETFADEIKKDLENTYGTGSATVVANEGGTYSVTLNGKTYDIDANGDVTRVVTGGTAVAAVTNPYSDESWAMAWTYSIDDGWSDTITDNEATLSGEVVAKAYKKGEEYHLVIEPIGESGGMGPLFTYATRKNLIASLPVYVVDSYIVGVQAPTPINQGWMNDYSVYSNITNVVICDGVTEIGDDAFRDCSNLTDVSIGNSVTTIGNSSFRGCSSLTSVDLPDSVTTIGAYTFLDCSSLTNVDLPDGVTTIDEGTFGRCTGLTSVTIGNSVTSIEREAFEGCIGLTSINIPGSVTTIGGYAFSTGGEMIIINIDKNEGTISGAPWAGLNYEEVLASENYTVKIKWKNAERYYQHQY